MQQLFWRENVCVDNTSVNEKKNFFKAHAVPSSKRVIYSYLSLDKRVIFDSFGQNQNPKNQIDPRTQHCL